MAQITVRDLITIAYREAQLIALGEVPKAKEAAMAMVELQFLVDSLKNELTFPPAVSAYTFSTSTGKIEYTIGIIDPSIPLIPDWAIDQNLIRIDAMQVLVGTVWQPLTQVSNRDYYRSSQAPLNAVIPQSFMYNRGRPYPTVHLGANANASYSVRVEGASSVDIINLDQVIELPDGYAACLAWGLASILLKIAKLDSTVHTEVYAGRLARLCSVNEQPGILTSGGIGRYDIFSDRYIGGR